MKIVYCTDTICHPGGIQTVTIAKANALAKIEGNYVWIAVTDHTMPPLISLENVILINLDVNYYADDWRGDWYIIKGVFLKRKLHKRRLQHVLNEIRPDVVISTGTSEKYFLPTLKIGSSPVFIREMHFEKNYRKRTAVRWVDKLMATVSNIYDYGYRIKKYHKIIVLTQEDKECNWKDRKNVEVIPNPVTGIVDGFSDGESNIALAAGRMVPQKNFQSLIRIWRRVTELHPDWILEIWGTGALKNDLEEQIERTGLQGKVQLKGYTHELLTKMREASIFCLSSKFEGFGLVLVEAMSVGLPVVSYMCPCGPKDIVTEGKDGFLIPMDDEDMFANRICALIDNKELRKRMGREAIQTSEKYHMGKIVDQWMSLFIMLRNEKS